VSHKLYSLSDFLKVNYGKALKKGERIESGQHPVFGSSGQVGNHDSAIVDYPTIIIGRKGSVGSVTLAPNGGWPIDTSFYIEPKGNIEFDLKYLFYALKNANLDRHTITTSIPGLNRDDLYRTQIPLPPLAEQKRIAAVLDKAAELRTKRQQAIAHLDTLLQSVFLDMFGDPAPSKWDRVKIEDLIQEGKNKMRTGPFGSRLLHSEFTDNPNDIMVLGIDNVVQNRFVYTNNRFITPEKYQDLNRFTVYAEDLLITIMWTCGRCAVVPANIPTAINTKHLCCMTLNQDLCLPIYLKYCFLLHPEVLHQLGVSKRGAIMDGLNMGIIKRLSIPLPPIEKQKQFALFVQKILAQTEKHQHGLENQENLFGALQQRAFRGEL